MVAFIRGSSSFLTADQIYVKVLPNGEARRLTDDPRLKYHLAFTPDGSQIAYTVLQPPSWVTYTVSVLGGDSHLFLSNAAGMTWLDQHQLLFSRTRSGQHMGIVTGTATGQEFRDLYFPSHERAMAHYSFASPDHQSALVVEMDENAGNRRFRRNAAAFWTAGANPVSAREGNFNYLEQMNPDGSGRSRVVPYPVNTTRGISPGPVKYRPELLN